MKKYRVCLIKYETYYVDAENEETAINAAYASDENNWLAWSDPVDEVEVEEVKVEEDESKAKIWIDNKTPAPKGYFWCKDIHEAISTIQWLDHDLVEIGEVFISHEMNKCLEKGHIKLIEGIRKISRDCIIKIGD